jgi:hypothetical protein
MRAWVHESLSTQAMHLADIPFAQGDGRYVLTFDPQETGTGRHPRGVRVLLHGGRLASWYRIQEQRYSQIGRTAPDGTRRINTIERYEAAADGRLYTTHSWHTSQPTVRAWSDSLAMSTSSSNTSPDSSCRHGGRSGRSKAGAPGHASSPCRPTGCWYKSPRQGGGFLAQGVQIVRGRLLVGLSPPEDLRAPGDVATRNVSHGCHRQGGSRTSRCSAQG